MRHVRQFLRFIHTTRAQLARSTVVALCALGASIVLLTPGHAFASSLRPTASAVADATPATCAADVAGLTMGRRLDAGQAIPQDPYEDCYKDLASELLAPLSDLLPGTCLGKVEQIFVKLMISATSELAAVSASNLTDAEKAERLASEWKHLRPREVFLDAMVELVKASPSCADLFLPAGVALDLVHEAVEFREAVEKSMAGFEHAEEALLKIENCVKDQLGPLAESLPTGDTSPDGPSPGNPSPSPSPGGNLGSGGGNPGFGEAPNFGQPSSEHTIGSSVLDVHLFPSDQGSLTFQGAGEFIAVKSSFDDLEIQVRQVPWQSSRLASFNSAVAMNVAGDRVGIYGNAIPPLRIAGVPTGLGPEVLQLPHGGQMSLREGTYVVVWPDGTIVHVSHRGSDVGVDVLGLYVAVPLQRRGNVAGLLGDFDPKPGHYPADRAGNFIPLQDLSREVYRTRVYNDFGDSWRIIQSESLFDYEPGEDTGTFTNLKFPYALNRPSELNAGQFEVARAVCLQAKVSTPRFLEACTEDIVASGDPWFAEAAAIAEATTFVRPPTQPGLPAAPSRPPTPSPTPPAGPTLAACDLFTLADAQVLSKSFLKVFELRGDEDVSMTSTLEWPGTGRKADEVCSYMEEFGRYLSVALFRNPTAAMVSSNAFPNLRRVQGLGDDVYVSECGFPALIRRGDVLVAFGVAEFFNKDGYSPDIASATDCGAWRDKVETLVRSVVKR
jgi:hypothetical protein